MSTTLLVQHTVENFEDWKLGFDAHDSARRLHGGQGHRVLRDGNDVTVLITFDSRSGAEAFTADPSLKEAMAKAGVVSAPSIAFLESVEDVSY
jgi:hypothetical protein